MRKAGGSKIHQVQDVQLQARRVGELQLAEGNDRGLECGVQAGPRDISWEHRAKCQGCNVPVAGRSERAPDDV